MHIRTMPYANFFSHLQLKISQQLVDKFICITENEYEHFMSILKHTNIENIKSPYKKQISKMNDDYLLVDFIK